MEVIQVLSSYNNNCLTQTDDWNNPGTVRYQAVEWLADTDQLTQDTGLGGYFSLADAVSGGSKETRFLERYVHVLSYFMNSIVFPEPDTHVETWSGTKGATDIRVSAEKTTAIEYGKPSCSKIKMRSYLVSFVLP